MEQQATEIKVIRPFDKLADGSEPADKITEPILVSFPQNVPTAKALKKMAFNVYQQDKPASKVQRAPKRVLKAEYKGI